MLAYGENSLAHMDPHTIVTRFHDCQGQAITQRLNSRYCPSREDLDPHGNTADNHDIAPLLAFVRS